MAGSVAVGQWFVLYMDGKPCILAGGPAAGTEKQMMEQYRTAMLGSLPEGTVLAVKNIYDAPVDDVLRVGVIALMTAVTNLTALLQGGAGRGVLRQH